MWKKIKLDPFLTKNMINQMVQRVKQQTSELMNKQINNTLKALEETGVNL